MSLNKVMLIGNLGKDPEVKYLDNNKVVATVTLATNENYTDRNGERRTETEWHAIELWDNLARIAEKYLKKGSQVYIEGRIRTDNWKDKEGVERSTKKIRANTMTLLGTRPGNSASDENRSNNNYVTNDSKENSNGNNSEVNSNFSQGNTADDDLPF